MKRTRKNVPKGFDSWLEFDLFNNLRKCEYHPDRIDYIQKKTYEPDFKYTRPDGHTVYIEAKGRFRDRAEARKYIDIREGLEDASLVFVFQNPQVSMPAAQRRADGTRLTMAEWATKNNFTYYCKDVVPKEWLK